MVFIQFIFANFLVFVDVHLFYYQVTSKIHRPQILL